MSLFVKLVSNIWVTFWAAMIILTALVVFPYVVLAAFLGAAAIVTVVVINDEHRRKNANDTIECRHFQRYGKQPQPWVGPSTHKRLV